MQKKVDTKATGWIRLFLLYILHSVNFRRTILVRVIIYDFCSIFFFRPNFLKHKTQSLLYLQILLLSLTAGGTGLNLCGANHLFFIDPHWNPQLESQAEDRIYRIGQTKPVTIYR